VRPFISPDGSVFYELRRDELATVYPETVMVPASEIIHDKYFPLFHELVGVPPLFACALAAAHGLSIARNQSTFFRNGGQPGGIITVPGAINPEDATAVKNTWDTEFSGDNAGKVAFLSDGMTYTALPSINADDAQIIEQLAWTDEAICRCFGVPGYMVGVGPPPTQTNVEALNQQYYSQCLQDLAESIELGLDEGLGLAPGRINGVQYGTEFDTDDLLRMDTATLIKAEKDATGIKKVNESRKRLGLPPVEGGNTVYVQQQYYSLEALNRRDQLAPAPSPGSDPPPTGDIERAIALYEAIRQRAAKTEPDAPDWQASEALLIHRAAEMGLHV
jgi:HK97 family phage portal protein